MKRTLLKRDSVEFPTEISELTKNADIYDSSCSPEAKVYFIDKECGYYLKSAPSGSLKTESEMTKYFHKKRIGANVLKYISSERDWLLTERVKGEDCTFQPYLDNPKRLCDTIAEILRTLHDSDCSDCPVQNRFESYYALAEKNYHSGNYDTSFLAEGIKFGSVHDIWKIAESNKNVFENNVLLHGDYCLPNIMLDDWKFSGFIDLGNGGIGDRHIDIFWGAWTLKFNLKTDKYRERFFDAYGRNDIEPEKLDIVAAFEVFG